MATDEQSVYVFEGPPRLELLREEGGRGHRLVVQRGTPGVVVVGLNGDDLMFVRVVRREGEVLELPRGFGEHAGGSAGDPCPDAIREFAEETGHALEDAEHVATFQIDTSVYPQNVCVVVGRTDPAGPTSSTDGETQGYVWASPQQVREWVRNGTLHDAITLAALAAWTAHVG